MTHFGENTEFIVDDPVNLMLPSDLTKTVSILNYGPPKFQSYENCLTQSPDPQSPDPQSPDAQSPDPQSPDQDILTRVSSILSSITLYPTPYHL